MCITKIFSAAIALVLLSACAGTPIKMTVRTKYGTQYFQSHRICNFISSSSTSKGDMFNQYRRVDHHECTYSDEHRRFCIDFITITHWTEWVKDKNGKPVPIDKKQEDKTTNCGPYRGR